MSSSLKFSLLPVVAVAVAVAVCSGATVMEREGKSDKMEHVYKVFEECVSKDLGTCLKLKFVAALDRLARKDELSIVEGISLVKDTSGPAPVENEVPEESRSLKEEDGDKLDAAVFDKVAKFFSARSLKFSLAGLSATGRGLQEEGRKKNKYGSLMMLPLMMGGSMIPMALGVLALLAGKALIIAKLALTLSLIIGLKKLLGSDDHASFQAAPHGGGHYRRSLQDFETAAQSMAYKSYIPLNAAAAAATAATAAADFASSSTTEFYNSYGA